MICPICKTNNQNNQAAEFCIQCGSDLHVLHLLHQAREEIAMQNKVEKEIHAKNRELSVSFVLQILQSIMVFAITVFVIFIGLRFLTFLDNLEPHNAPVSMPDSKGWSQAGFEQLRQMNNTIKEELDFIIEQHRENQELQAKVQNLIVQLPAASQTQLCVSKLALIPNHNTSLRQ